MGLRITEINPESTALLVIDMQHDFLDRDAAMLARTARDAVAPTQRALQAARDVAMSVFFTVHSHRRDGADEGLFGAVWPPIAQRTACVAGTRGTQVIDELAPRDGEPVVPKHRYSAFFHTDLEVMLRQRRVETVVICGTTTECCCHATARDALFRDYRVVVLGDATGTFDHPDHGFGALSAEEVHRVTLAMLASTTGDVMSADEFSALVTTP